MCGIVGFWDKNHQLSHESYGSVIHSMADAITYRGPNSSGHWLDKTQGLALGHRRLSIVDLSEAGHQPMVSSSKRFVISYNGEIYNTNSLKKPLEKLGYRFLGHCDTEVLLAACEAWGVEKACQESVGMFAFALWDTQEKKLFLARDRLGIKPLYYGVHKQTFFFGSELKAFYPHPLWEPEIDREAQGLFLKFNYIPREHVIFKGLNKLLPGKILCVDQFFQSKESTYWSLDDFSIKADPNKKQKNLNDEEAINTLEKKLIDAVDIRMHADVPLGAFLSGGVDSSTVVAIMQSLSKKPIKTFSIGFHESSYNEAQYAKEVANYLQTEHHELYVTAEQARAVIPNIATMYDEPFADSSQIPTFLVSKLAKQHVTVSLSGDGGDELFLGYERYLLGRKVWQNARLMPYPMRCLLAKMLKKITPVQWESIIQFFPKRYQFPRIADKAYKLAEVLNCRTAVPFYQSLVSIWKEPADILEGMAKLEYPLHLYRECVQGQFSDDLSMMSYLDTLSYLPDDILTKVDRATMANSLEGRVPLLDHRVVEYAWFLPLHMKLRQGQGKWLLRQVLYKYVPKKLIERPKMGFGVPIGEWLRGPLQDWAESLLEPKSLETRGFKPDPIHKIWKEHLKEKNNWQYLLWGVLMYQQWADEWLTKSPSNKFAYNTEEIVT